MITNDQVNVLRAMLDESYTHRYDALAAAIATIEGLPVTRDGVRVSELTVTLPLPPKELSPNHYIGSRGGRLGKAAKAKAYRERARHEAGIAAHVAGLTQGGWTHAQIQIVWHHPTKRYPDRDNIIAWMKAGIDGVRDSGLLANDDEVHYPSPVREVDKLNPRVELRITQLESEAK